MLTRLASFGARARPINTTLSASVLIIGLGQVGMEAIALLQEMLRYSLPPRELQAHTRLFAIAQRRALSQEQLLPREMRLLLDQEVVSWSDVPGRYAATGVARWWPRTPNNQDLHQNPSPARAFGRLMVWNNAQLIGEKLHQLTGWLKDSSEREQLPCQIIVLASLAEPEGSGMLFDLVGRLRDLASNATITGIFTADTFYNDELERLTAMATAYATIKELDATSLSPESYPHELPWVGSAGAPMSDLPARPFDYLCLTGDTTIPNPHPEEAIVEFTTSWLLSLITGTRQPNLALSTTVQLTEQDRYPGYTLFGVSKLALPVKAVLDYHAIETAKIGLRSLLWQNPAPVETWVQKVINRAHSDLLTRGLLEHHKVSDQVKDIRRRLLYSNLNKQRQKNTGLFTRRDGGLREIIGIEWQRLLRENEAESMDEDGVITRRDVLRSRMSEALNPGYRALIEDMEQAAVSLAYGEGRGLPWTYAAFRELASQIEKIIEKARQTVDLCQTQAENLREQWFAASHGRDPDLVDKLTQEIIVAIATWIGWQVRLHYWEEACVVAEDLRKRLHNAIQQVPGEIDKLQARSKELRNAMDIAAQQGPKYPAGALYDEQWMQNGLSSINPPSELAPDVLISTLFSRWDVRLIPPTRQLQRFPMDILEPTRLLIQPQTRFANIHDFVVEYQDNNVVRQNLIDMRLASAPGWLIKPPTEKLENSYAPPLALEVIREMPRVISLVPHSENQRAVSVRLPSPDPDEVVVIRMMHGWSAQHVKVLREDYRRAYYRISADNVPLHVDRRWETTMADLIHTSLRSEISALWEAALQASQRGVQEALPSLQAINRSIITALDGDVERVQVIPPVCRDIQMFLYPLKPFRLKVPPPQCAFVFLMAQRSSHEIAEDLAHTVLNTVLAENFLFVVNMTGRPDIETILEGLRGQSYMPLVLSEADIKHLVSAPKPASALRDIVISRVNLTAVSPFYTRAPVPDHMFFGREKEIADVRSKLNTHSVVLIGGRRIGKTSTIQKIKRALDSTPDASMIAYYLDCSNVLQHSHFFRRIQRDWDLPVREDTDPIEFDDVVDQLTKRHGGKKPVFLLDEVDRLLKTDQGASYDEPLFRTFRALSNEKRCQFLFSGEKLLLRSVRNAHSVLFNFPKAVHLGPLQKDTVRRLVTEPFEMLNIWLEQADELIQQIYEISAGHPNIVQTICHVLVTIIDRDKHSNLLKRDHLGLALDIHQVQEDIVETIWGQMHPIAKLVTLLWPENVTEMTLEDMIGMIHQTGLTHIKRQAVKENVIPDLELYNFVRQVGQDYRLIPVFFPTIIDFMTDKRMEIQTILETHHEI